MAQRLSADNNGGCAAHFAVSMCARLQSRKSLQRSCARDILGAVPGAERMSRWWALPRKAARLQDAYSGNKDISGKSKGLDGCARSYSGTESSWPRGVCRPTAGINAGRPLNFEVDECGGVLQRERKDARRS